MSSQNIYHYVYSIEDLKPPSTQKFYIGVRSSKVEPEKDCYMGSSSDSDFVSRMKSTPENFKKSIIFVFNSRHEANEKEIYLHDLYDVGVNETYYNKAKHTSNGFCVYGKATAICRITGEQLGSINKDDPRWATKEILPLLVGMALVKDKPHNKNKQNAKCNSTGISLGRVSLTDPRWNLGEIVGATKGNKHTGITGTHNAKCGVDGLSLGRIPLDDPRWETGEIVSFNKGNVNSWTTGKIAAKDIELNSIGSISKNDPRWIDNTIIMTRAKHFYIITKDDSTKIIYKKDFREFEGWSIIQ